MLAKKKHLFPRRDFILSSIAGMTQVCAAAKPRPEMAIIHPGDGTPLETLAARELCRYIYLRTGALLRIAPALGLPKGFRGFVVSQKNSPLLTSLPADPGTRANHRGSQTPAVSS